MGFKAYRIQPLADGEWLLDQPQPLRFAGVNGLVARWCRERHTEIGDRLWIVEDSAWLRLVFGEAGAATSRWIVFEQAGPEGFRLSRLERVSGTFGSETRLGFQFSALEDVVPCGAGLIARRPAKGCAWSEELGLDGGPHSPGCTWQWRAAKLAMSAAIAGPVRWARQRALTAPGSD